MKIVKKSFVCFMAFACLCVFGAWTPAESEVRYADAAFLSTYAEETITYTNRVSDVYNSTVNGVPQYIQKNGLTNACGAIAGSQVIGFYDKYFPDLIPGWESFYPTGAYRKQDSVYVEALMNDLYTRMRTNVDDVGVSEQDFLNGLKSYVNAKGHSLTYSQVATATSINYAACKSAIDSNNVIVVFSRPVDLYVISTGDGQDRLMTMNIDGYHIMIAYGYEEVKYYNANGLFRTDTYLGVATGRPVITTALYNINPHNLDAAYAITIR